MEFREATLVAFGIEMGRRVMSLKRQSCCHQASCHRKGRSGCGCFGVLLLDFVVVVVWGAREGGGGIFEWRFFKQSHAIKHGNLGWILEGCFFFHSMP